MSLTLKKDQLKLYEIGEEGDGYSTTEDLMTAYKSVQGRVDAYTETYGQINVDVTMKQLVHAGSLLRVAYAAAGDSEAAAIILELFSKHQSFLGDCVTVTASFVKGCLDSLEHHFDALDALQGDTDDDKVKAIAMRALARCGKIATTMAEEADKVVVKATDMENKSETALLAAKKSQAKTVDEKKAVERMRDEASSRKKRREAEIKELNECIEELKEQETKFEKKADREAAKATRMLLVKAVVGAAATIAAGPAGAGMSAAFLDPHDDSDPGTTKSNGQPDASAQEREARSAMAKESSNLAEQELEVKRIEREIEDLKKEGESDATKEKIAQAEEEMKKAKAEVDRLRKVVNETKSDLNNIASRHIAAAESAEAKASAAAAQRAAKLDQRREAAGDLAAAAEDLANLKVERSELIKAIKALDVCVKLMGQIKTTFTNVRIFWEAIAKMCLGLSKYDEQQMNDMSIKRFGKYIERQMVQWIGLGRLNYNANGAIKQALALVDEGMSSLPTKAEAQKILELEADGIAKMLKAEYKKIVVLEHTAAQDMLEV